MTISENSGIVHCSVGGRGENMSVSVSTVAGAGESKKVSLGETIEFNNRQVFENDLKKGKQKCRFYLFLRGVPVSEVCCPRKQFLCVR